MNFNEHYDVIIVGAGPAGLSAAKSCAEGGLSTLVLEKNRAIGTPVQCGEAIGRFVFEQLGLEVDPTWHEIRTLHAFSPGLKCLTINFGEPSMFLVGERKMFEKRSACAVAKLGASISTSTTAVDVLKTDGSVTGVQVERGNKTVAIGSRIVIAADGPVSRIAQRAGLHVYRAPGKFESCAQLQMANIDIEPHVAEMYFTDMAPGGYVWLFPKGTRFANVGIGIYGNSDRTAMDCLTEFIGRDPRLREGSVIETNAGIVPVGGALERLSTNGLMVVGDAARQANPMTGGGVRFAVDAGLKVGELAVKAITKGDCSTRVLANYDKWWRRRFSKVFRASFVAKEILLESPAAELDALFAEIGTIDAPRYQKGKDILLLGVKKLLPALLRHPKLLLKLRRVRGIL